jgi:hypothetical protein
MRSVVGVVVPGDLLGAQLGAVDRDLVDLPGEVRRPRPGGVGKNAVVGEG